MVLHSRWHYLSRVGGPDDLQKSFPTSSILILGFLQNEEIHVDQLQHYLFYLSPLHPRVTSGWAGGPCLQPAWELFFSFLWSTGQFVWCLNGTLRNEKSGECSHISTKLSIPLRSATFNILGFGHTVNAPIHDTLLTRLQWWVTLIGKKGEKTGRRVPLFHLQLWY